MSTARPFISDEDDEGVNASDSDLEILDFDDGAFELEITGVVARTPQKIAAIKWPDIELNRYKLRKGCVIAPGDTVELKDERTHDDDTMCSGDFLRVKHIISNFHTNEVRLRGHRLRRTEYLDQIFEWRLNELAMMLNVNQTDTRCPLIAGMEDVPIDDVLNPRDCVLTNELYPLLSVEDHQRCAYPVSLGKREIEQQVFHGGSLACRHVIICHVCNNGKSYSLIRRHLYAREADTLTAPVLGAGQSRNDSIVLDEEVGAFTVSNGLLGRRSRSGSDSSERASSRCRLLAATKSKSFTLGDVFCGAGGASQGAKQADLTTKWSLDADLNAIQTYRDNHPGVLSFRCNAHDFPPQGFTCEEMQVDVLHISPPCDYFSPNHTIDGPNDQANLEALYTVGPIIGKVKPRVATLEQTSGLMTGKKHVGTFRMLLRDIGEEGYDLRCKIQNLSEFGLCQQRPRLLIIAARRGTPLPPFPKATHGPAGTKPWHYIKDALIPIERLGSRATGDRYHQPKPARKPRSPYDPRSFIGCITRSGANKYHYSGKRKYTPRELSQFQGFPLNYKFFGSRTTATEQIGNAFPPPMGEALYRNIAKTLEAFDGGYIEAEDDLTDLDGILERKGANLQHMRPAARTSFDPPSRPADLLSRYLVRDGPAGQATPSGASPFARRKDPVPRRRDRAINLMAEFLGHNEDDNDHENIEVRPRRRRRTAVYIDNETEPTWISESE